MTELKRSSGLLLHPTSLPGRFGIGDMGASAYQWIDFLAAAKQSIWQILPLGPTGYGNSPYSTTSVFAGNPLLIDLSQLVAAGYISESDLHQAPHFPDHYVDFEAVIGWKLPLLLHSYPRFASAADDQEKANFQHFCHKHGRIWLDEFATFMAFKNHFGGGAWIDWPLEIRQHKPAAVKELQQQLSAEIEAHKYLQFQFFKQWSALKDYANGKHLQIFGDIPIYVSHDSAEVWANQHLFRLDGEGNPTVVAGVPPDYFSETGQLWGNPIYDWDRMKKNGFRWWIQRLQIMLETVDVIRIDHFRGFESFWAVPFGEETAVNGEWLKGPGNALFDALLAAHPNLPIVVEDLGFITPEVRKLRDDYGFPGMKILQFAFGGDPDEPFLPHNYDRNCLVYTGSHDNDTTLGWFNTAPDHEKENCVRYIGGLRDDISWEMIRLACASCANMAVYPVQDVLSLGGEHRMNTPGRASGNWSWRFLPNQLQDYHRQKLASLTHIYGRAPRPADEPATNANSH